jgi:hypothetical protein
MSKNEEWLRRFQREGKAARRFKHPNAIAVYDLRISQDGTTYMVLEYIDGQNLRDELSARGTFEAEELLPILEQIASVLDAGHKSGVVHRDLKPDNVMLTTAQGGAPLVKVLDLGIAKLRETGADGPIEVSALTIAGQIIGTPHYMSPEQWGEIPSDGGREIDGRADVYSLAVMTYELLTGKWPVSGTDIMELRRGHVTGLVTPLKHHAPHYSDEFAAVIARGMAKDRVERCATAGEFVKQLKHAAGLSGRGADAGGYAVDDSSEAAGPMAVETLPVSGKEPTHSRLPPVETVASGTVRTAESAEADGMAVSQIGDSTIDTGVQSAPSGEVIPLRRGLLAFAALALLVVGVAAAWNLTRPAPSKSREPAPAIASQPQSVPLLSYYLETVARDNSTDRVTGENPLTMDQGFRLHVTARQDGYIYIVVAGSGNVPTALLTAIPPKTTGWTTNRIEAGASYSFPTSSAEQEVIDLGPETLATPFTIIYASEPVASPEWLAGPSPRTLNPNEQLELEQFIAANRGGVTVVPDSESGSGVQMLVSAVSGEARKALLIELVIRHVESDRRPTK